MILFQLVVLYSTIFGLALVHRILISLYQINCIYSNIFVYQPYPQHLNVPIILQMDHLFPERVSDILNIKGNLVV